MDLSKQIGKHDLGVFVNFINATSDAIGFKVSSRGWGYILEQKGIITKDQFDKVEALINRCRKRGLLPVDFVAEESSRAFHEIHKPTTRSIKSHVASWLQAAYDCDDYYHPNWWAGEEYYIQMLVEKIDLVTLFQPLCRDYHIPIANSKGWSSILQRAEYTRRFQEAEAMGLKCVLLYCGDHDPDGLRISDTIRKNLDDVSKVYWEDGGTGYDPENLIIDRFGLNYDFIIRHKLTWIDNLITGSGKDLADPRHPNYNLPYNSSYRKKVGKRKCEANSVVIVPEMGRDLCREAIVKYLGNDALNRFSAKKEAIREQIYDVMEEIEIKGPIEEAIEKLTGNSDDE